MAKRKSVNVRRTGAYVVKAAESRSTMVPAKPSGHKSTPSPGDKALAQKLLSRRAK
ncbi:MAG TPA: hypothetical protein VGW75_04005 [Solirubrobacteraceae bacterium]|jgi:hypothetical protein|nr:hypothetical protein [Solirubrobacteraceae bacterium]